MQTNSCRKILGNFIYRKHANVFSKLMAIKASIAYLLLITKFHNINQMLSAFFFIEFFFIGKLKHFINLSTIIQNLLDYLCICLYITCPSSSSSRCNTQVLPAKSLAQIIIAFRAKAGVLTVPTFSRKYKYKNNKSSRIHEHSIQTRPESES